MLLRTFDEKILFRSGRLPLPTNPMATLLILVITTTAATLTTRRDLGNLSDFLIQEFIEPMSRCYTTDPKKRWEYCDVPLYKDYLNPATKGADYTGKISKTKSGRDCQVFHPHPIHPINIGSDLWVRLSVHDAETQLMSFMSPNVPLMYISANFVFIQVAPSVVQNCT